MNLTPARVGLLGFAVAITFFWTLLNTTGHGWFAWYRLATTGQAATATITDIQPDQHRGCSFLFMIDGKANRGSAHGCSQLGVGSELPVTYLHADPTFVSTGNPVEELRFEILGPLVLAVLAGFASGWRFREWQSSRAQ